MLEGKGFPLLEIKSVNFIGGPNGGRLVVKASIMQKKLSDLLDQITKANAIRRTLVL